MRGTRAAATTRRLQQLTRQLSSSSGAEEASVVYESHGGNRVAILNRPKALNALSLEMVRSLAPTIEAWESDASVSSVIIKGAGAKAFCAGGDVVEVVNSANGTLGDGGATARDFFYEEYELDYKIATLDMPVIAIIDGITMGGGVGLSMFADFRVATENTLFAMPETGIGLFPDVGGSYFLPRCVLILMLLCVRDDGVAIASAEHCDNSLSLSLSLSLSHTHTFSLSLARFPSASLLRNTVGLKRALGCTLH